MSEIKKKKEKQLEVKFSFECCPSKSANIKLLSSRCLFLVCYFIYADDDNVAMLIFLLVY